MVVSEGFSKTQRWYNQFNVPKKLRDKQVLGVWMPVSTGYEDLPEVENPATVNNPEEKTAPQHKESTVEVPPDGSSLTKPSEAESASQCVGDDTDTVIGKRAKATGTTAIGTTAKYLISRMVANPAMRTINNYVLLELLRGDPDYKILKTVYNSTSHSDGVRVEKDPPDNTYMHFAAVS